MECLSTNVQRLRTHSCAADSGKLPKTNRAENGLLSCFKRDEVMSLIHYHSEQHSFPKACKIFTVLSNPFFCVSRHLTKQECVSTHTHSNLCLSSNTQLSEKVACLAHSFVVAQHTQREHKSGRHRLNECDIHGGQAHVRVCVWIVWVCILSVDFPFFPYFIILICMLYVYYLIVWKLLFGNKSWERSESRDRRSDQSFYGIFYHHGAQSQMEPVILTHCLL